MTTKLLLPQSIYKAQLKLQHCEANLQKGFFFKQTTGLQSGYLTLVLKHEAS